MTQELTMLALVRAIAEYAGTDEEIVAIVIRLVNSGAVRLCGTFRDTRFDVDATGVSLVG